MSPFSVLFVAWRTQLKQLWNFKMGNLWIIYWAPSVIVLFTYNTLVQLNQDKQQHYILDIRLIDFYLHWHSYYNCKFAKIAFANIIHVNMLNLSHTCKILTIGTLTWSIMAYYLKAINDVTLLGLLHPLDCHWYQLSPLIMENISAPTVCVWSERFVDILTYFSIYTFSVSNFEIPLFIMNIRIMYTRLLHWILRENALAFTPNWMSIPPYAYLWIF